MTDRSFSRVIVGCVQSFRRQQAQAKIQKEEAKQQMLKEEEEALKKKTENQSQKLWKSKSLEETVEIFYEQKKILRECENVYREVFDQLDSDKNGSLDVNELKYLHELNLQYVMALLHATQLNEIRKKPNTPKAQKVAVKMVQAFLDAVDVNHDGCISFEEFLVYITEHYLNPKVHYLFSDALKDCEAKRQKNPKQMVEQYYQVNMLSHDYDDVYKEAWSSIDIDGSGRLTKPEMRRFAKVFIIMEEREFDCEIECTEEDFHKSQKEIDDYILNKILKEYDYNYYATIDYDQFLLFIGKHVPLTKHDTLCDFVKMPNFEECTHDGTIQTDEVSYGCGFIPICLF